MQTKFHFNRHPELSGSHAMFSASQYSWLRYDDDKLIERYNNRNRTRLGTELHEYAKSQIDLSQKVSTIKNLVQNISTFIYTKYLTLESANLGSLDYGLNLVRDLSILPKEVFETLKLYINDAIGYRLDSEVTLRFTDEIYGTADAISFKDRFLRIHDLKTGDTKVKMDQLEIYAAIFCLEYGLKPGVDIDRFELRIYQNEEIIVHNPTASDILPIMDRIIYVDKFTSRLEEEG